MEIASRDVVLITVGDKRRSKWNISIVEKSYEEKDNGN